MKVLLRQVDEMQAAVRESVWHPVFNGHTLQQTCFFIELYCLAVSELSAALISMMELNTFVSGYCNFRPSPCSSLFDWMAPEYNSLEIRFSTVDLIQERHLRSWILPQHYGVLVQSQLERCQLLRDGWPRIPRGQVVACTNLRNLLRLSMRRWRLTFLLSAGARALRMSACRPPILAMLNNRCF